jgi:transaldolase / glucose-6-phosphate isomerase
MDLKDLQKYSQSLWLDFTRRDLLTCGELARLVKDDGLDVITQQLLDDGVKAFSSAFDKLLLSIESKRQAVLARLAKPQATTSV